LTKSVLCGRLFASGEQWQKIFYTYIGAVMKDMTEEEYDALDEDTAMQCFNFYYSANL